MPAEYPIGALAASIAAGPPTRSAGYYPLPPDLDAQAKAFEAHRQLVADANLAKIRAIQAQDRPVPPAQPVHSPARARAIEALMAAQGFPGWREPSIAGWKPNIDPTTTRVPTEAEFLGDPTPGYIGDVYAGAGMLKPGATSPTLIKNQIALRNPPVAKQAGYLSSLSPAEQSTFQTLMKAIK